jgi:branched-subunit amino acid transport protein
MGSAAQLEWLRLLAGMPAIAAHDPGRNTMILSCTLDSAVTLPSRARRLKPRLE